MMVSRNYPDGQDSIALLNRGIARLEASGEAERLIAPYLK
jgi:hypothetical protein